MVVEKVDGTELRFKNPGRLLLVVIAFFFWGVGFLDLIGHTSAEPDVFGLYSLSFFVFILLYGSTIAVWILLFFNASLLARLTDVIRWIQNKSWMSLAALAAVAFALWVILEWDRWGRLPGLQFAAFGLTVLLALILLFAHWPEMSQRQAWRKMIAYPLAALLVVEVLVQAAASFGALPGRPNLGGNFYPYERVYHSEKSPRSGFANRYGWYYPDTDLDDDKIRVLVVGGSYVQAINVQPEQQFSVLLAEAVNQNRADRKTQAEILPISLRGFGLSPFIHAEYFVELPSLLPIDEMVVFIHLGDDFQSPIAEDNAIRYRSKGEQAAEIHPDYARLRHDLTHYYMRGFMSFQLVETIRSNYLTPKVLTTLARGDTRTVVAGKSTSVDPVDFPRLVGFVNSQYAVTEPGHAGIKSTAVKVIPAGNNFMFAQGGDEERRAALAVIESLLKEAQHEAKAQGITLRVVTVPAFPEAFFTTYKGSGWQPHIGGYDLFLPEAALMEIAQKYGISILPMGQYILQDGLAVDEIRALYDAGSPGSFTPTGHAYFAQAMYSSFYATGP
jgi:hypothetical protein